MRPDLLKKNSILHATVENKTHCQLMLSMQRDAFTNRVPPITLYSVAKINCNGVISSEIISHAHRYCIANLCNRKVKTTKAEMLRSTLI